MSGTTSPVAGHAALMDTVYRRQRHFYDLTRKYYLFGRDAMIRALDLANGGTVLEIACGTGRNLALVRGAWPRAALFGIDISVEMLKSAEARLGDDARLARGDATCFDPQALLGQARFDRIIMSYCTSMIPQWERSVEHAIGMLAPGGTLHIVDFGDMAGLPRPLRGMLRGWLARFHVIPRHDFARGLGELCEPRGLAIATGSALGGYYQTARIDQPA